MKTNLGAPVLALTFSALFVSGSVSALPTEEALNRAADCLSDTGVNRFNADPGVVFPGSATTLSWRVNVPPGCGVSLYVRGLRVNRTGSLSVTPTFPITSYALEGRMLGLSSILAQTPVTVNTDACRELALPATLLAQKIQDVLDAYDAGEPEIKQTRAADISIAPNGLALTMYFEVDKFGPNPSVRLAMRLTFNTVDGVVFPRFSYFHPQASTYLPDDWIESKIYGKQAGILDSFKTEINELLTDPSFALIDSAIEKLFSVETIDEAVLATVCPLPRRLEIVPFFPTVSK